MIVNKTLWNKQIGTNKQTKKCEKVVGCFQPDDKLGMNLKKIKSLGKTKIGVVPVTCL